MNMNDAPEVSLERSGSGMAAGPAVNVIKVAPSILSADILRLGEEVLDVDRAGADMIHLDIMDGMFVPNITFGPFVVEAVRKVTSLPLDVHLMIADPGRYVREFASAGADILTVHAEACVHLHRTVQTIKDLGMKAGVAINPGTPVCALEEVLDQVDLVLIMSVNPGFGGQSFIESSLNKIARARAAIRPGVDLEVDGGINDRTAGRAVAAGATVLVAGSWVFSHPDRREAIEALRRR